MPATPLPQALAGVKALFFANYLPLRDAQGLIVAPLIGPIVRVIPSTQGEEVLTALGAAPGLAEWKGELTPEKLAAWKQTVINRLFDASVEIARSDQEDDRVGQYDAAFQDMAARGSYHPAEMVAATLEANGTAFDGTALFASNRTIGESGTINNLLTPAMAGSSPTNLEVETAVLAVIAAMKAFKNNKGKPAIIAPKFSLIVPTALEPAATVVSKNEILGQGSTQKTNDARGKFDPIELAFLTSDVVAYMAVTNYAAKPVVMTDREPLSMTQDDENSPNWRLNEKSVTRVRARREMAPGVPWLIAKMTFTKTPG